MLAEKFFLVLETLRSNNSSDIIMISAAPHIPVKLPHPHTYPLRKSKLHQASGGNSKPFADLNSARRGLSPSPQNITFGAMRSSEVRGHLIYRADYHCSRSIAIRSNAFK